MAVAEMCQTNSNTYDICAEPKCVVGDNLQYGMSGRDNIAYQKIWQQTLLTQSMQKHLLPTCLRQRIHAFITV